ncbi:UvrD-helicase domain-containing protein [Thalassotalea sp. Y01]|uniref:UvrD-helicase domain-containing protein n=1 Tax=Thalassotalea sp. Y01 TaxID=2729613 RepID=UPI00145E2924|nr:UvrD-helicase domain-containing protein [Thalassotalea sp. Y01]NMP16114.1 UvrD-helicase domain-containing protein [Thalassotalea sp. Y01]
MDSLAPSIFGRIFSSLSPVALDDTGLLIPEGDSSKLIKWSELTAPITFEFGLLGQAIAFSTSSRSYKFSMMAYSSEYFLHSRCQDYWIKGNLPQLDSLLGKIDKAVNLRFLRQSTVGTIKNLVLQEHRRWLPWLTDSKSFSTISRQIQLLEKYVAWNDELTKHFQEKYVQTQLQRHQLFFDNVEANPLTERQRRACVIDDDNNLLLAGAGTGKTSVMVGRAGFLVESNQAEYKDILLLAYGRKAADEMDERIQDKLATDKIKAATFHSVGLQIISQVERAKPSLSNFAEDEKAKAKWVQDCFESLIDNHPEYRSLVFSYFSKYYYVEKNDFDFETLGDYYQYLEDNDIRSLKGDKVKSFGELYIANWLFYHGIDYEYEAAFQFDVKTIERRQYQPDFYLPEYDLYIEYYGIDEEGNTAPYINKDEYHNAMTWKAETHERFGTKCIPLTYAQHKRGHLLQCLQKALTEHEISYELLPVESILASLKETGRITVLAELFGQLLGLYKGANLTDSDERGVIERSADAKQTEKALELLKPILSQYNQHLRDREEIDFEDMIVKAIDYVESGRFVSPWKYIMVDEFQDISEPRARLVKALRNSHRGCSVFAVGDDWQAIYRFSGADIRLTTQFEQYFGFTTQTALNLTFRFNNKIGQVASEFIGQNPDQIDKEISSLRQESTPAISLLRRGSGATGNYYQSPLMELSNGAIDDVLQSISTRVTKSVTVYLLARFWFQLPNKADVKALCAKYPLLKIDTQSFHASKGKEADYVIVLGMQKGKHGFPCEKATPPILDAMLPQKEAFAHAEERRLFYVALTRAKHRAYIIADMANASCFVNELIADHEIETDEFISECDQIFVQDINCMRCDTGTLKKRDGRFGAFYSCSMFPRCGHVEKPCSQCESPMTRTRYTGFKLCINNGCNHIVPVCEKCGAEMALRNGPKGEFWGCRNYKGNEEFSCRNGKDKSSIQWPELVN